MSPKNISVDLETIRSEIEQLVESRKKLSVKIENRQNLIASLEAIAKEESQNFPQAQSASPEEQAVDNQDPLSGQSEGSSRLDDVSHIRSSEDVYKEPRRRLSQNTADMLYFVGAEGGKHKDQVAEFVGKIYGTKPESTKSMLNVHARDFGFVEQLGAGIYQLTDRGSKYLKENGFKLSPKGAELMDAPTSVSS